MRSTDDQTWQVSLKEIDTQYLKMRYHLIVIASA